MSKKAIIITVSAVVGVAVLITGTVLLLNSKFVKNLGKTDSGEQSSISSGASDVSGVSGGQSGSSDNSGTTSTGSNDSSGSSAVTSTGDTTTFTVGTASGSKGKKVSIPVDVSSNKGFMAGLVLFNYDTKALKYTGYKRPSVMTGDYDVQETESGTVKFLFCGNNDITSNGTVINLEFEIVTDEAQVTPVKITINKDGIANYNEQYVPVATVDGSVTIK